MSPDDPATTTEGSADGSPPLANTPDWDAIDYRIVPAIRGVPCAKLRARLARFAGRWSPSPAPKRPGSASLFDGKSLGAGDNF